MLITKIGRRFYNNKEIFRGTSRRYIEAQYEKWIKDKTSVDSSWNRLFQKESENSLRKTNICSDWESKTKAMIKFLRNEGHFSASLDPLGIKSLVAESNKNEFKSFELDPLNENSNKKAINNIYSKLKKNYSGSIGYEVKHLLPEESKWITDRVESNEFSNFTSQQKKVILERILRAGDFENFLALKWSLQKRFGIEGTESMIPALEEVLDNGSSNGIKDVVIGMPHRGRLNVLANVLKKPTEQIFSEFEGALKNKKIGSGDVKYHCGCSADYIINGKNVHVSLVPNPSHLEACNSIVLGKTKAKQDFCGDLEGKRSFALLIHGDASFYGQGSSYESMMLSDTIGFQTGGVIHIVCNNQIGYTTDPIYTRKSSYCTNSAKAFGAPIFHVNAEDMESVISVCRMAVGFRQRFKRDVVIDLIGYRKFGHNEGDEPRFTQPLMYSIIEKKQSISEIYSNKLINEKIITKLDLKNLKEKIKNEFENSFTLSKNLKTHAIDWFGGNWLGFYSEEKNSLKRQTCFDLKSLKKIGNAVTTVPKGFKVHKRILNVLNQRKMSIKTGNQIDWGLAEALSFGSLLKEGINVRLTGQDVERGTFSHRHSILVDQEPVFPQKTYCPLKVLDERKAKFIIINSPLSEFGVLGYEYGYSLESPKNLVIWESQYGDFANEAQVIFDQFISSGEAKWLRQSGLVVLLPHGYDGGGPEHSSARIERYLQMSDESSTFPLENDFKDSLQIQKSNWQIVNCTTPANYFHVLRRQVHRNFRKPLIIFSPKSLLKLRESSSHLNEFCENTHFKWVYDERDSEIDLKKSRKVIFCSGKIYFDLVNERKLKNIKDVIIVTIEQLSPFPFQSVNKIIKRNKNAEILWAQEEPKNMGAFTYVKPRLETCLKLNGIEKKEIIYSGRLESASPATGFGMKEHKLQQKLLIENAFK